MLFVLLVVLAAGLTFVSVLESALGVLVALLSPLEPPSSPLLPPSPFEDLASSLRRAITRR